MLQKERDIETQWDMGPLLKTVENDWGLLKEIIDLYCADAPRQLQRIRDGIAQQDPLLVQDAAHALKGSSTAFGKTPAYVLAFELEQAGRAKDLSQAETCLTQLQQAVFSLEKALHAALLQHKKESPTGMIP